MASRQPRESKRPPKAARPAKPQDEWRDAEQQSPATEAAAQELLERTGSPERAKDAIDKVEDAHPP